MQLDLLIRARERMFVIPFYQAIPLWYSQKLPSVDFRRTSLRVNNDRVRCTSYVGEASSILDDITGWLPIQRNPRMGHCLSSILVGHNKFITISTQCTRSGKKIKLASCRTWRLCSRLGWLSRWAFTTVVWVNWLTSAPAHWNYLEDNNHHYVDEHPSPTIHCSIELLAFSCFSCTFISKVSQLSTCIILDSPLISDASLGCQWNSISTLLNLEVLWSTLWFPLREHMVGCHHGHWILIFRCVWIFKVSDEIPVLPIRLLDKSCS